MASLHFCSECNNLLYPKADPDRRVLVYACRMCPYDETASNMCIYRNDLLTITNYVARRAWSRRARHKTSHWILRAHTGNAVHLSGQKGLIGGGVLHCCPKLRDMHCAPSRPSSTSAACEPKAEL